jgi:SAM-dependent MidA family methyltransferase
MHSLAQMLASGEGGAAILIDYGFPAHEYYLAERMQGTLMCHYRHHAHTDPFFLPGLQDITSHVDFSTIARTAIDEGLELLCYMNQAAFLLAAGIGDLLLRTPPEDAASYLPQARAVGMLLSPSEMGELFKVIVVGKKIGLPPQYLQYDRSDRL